MSPLVKVHGAQVDYPGHSVKLPDLELHPAQELALVGPSGSGKTTLLHVLAGLVRPSQGMISAMGVELSVAGESQIERYRREVSLVFQDFHLLEGYTALENVMAVLGLSGVPISQAVQRSKETLVGLSLGHRLKATPAQLSTGERQRVAIARALVTQPKLLLVDEPTAHLDSERAHLVISLLRELARQSKAALIVATHDPLVIQAIPRRVNCGNLPVSVPFRELLEVAS